MTFCVMEYGGRCRGFEDFIAAVHFLQGCSEGAQLWKLCPDGWMMLARKAPPLARKAPPPARRRQTNWPMNRETLVQEL